mmetsp:Transcript_13498/g.42016  ORF Transcript_13498/g.42016 Transcript_13498/m.42016 type:complete len:220 (-) Transcript_13498:156-815(-)
MDCAAGCGCVVAQHEHPTTHGRRPRPRCHRPCRTHRPPRSRGAACARSRTTLPRCCWRRFGDHEGCAGQERCAASWQVTTTRRWCCSATTSRAKRGRTPGTHGVRSGASRGARWRRADRQSLAPPARRSRIRGCPRPMHQPTATAGLLRRQRTWRPPRSTCLNALTTRACRNRTFRTRSAWWRRGRRHRRPCCGGSCSRKRRPPRPPRRVARCPSSRRG